MCFLERESLAPVHFFGNICLGGAFLKGERTASDFFIVKSGLGADLLVLCVVFEEARVDEALDCGGCGVSRNIDLDIFCQRTCCPKCLDALTAGVRVILTGVFVRRSRRRCCLRCLSGCRFDRRPLRHRFWTGRPPAFQSGYRYG